MFLPSPLVQPSPESLESSSLPASFSHMLFQSLAIHQPCLGWLLLVTQLILSMLHHVAPPRAFQSPAPSWYEDPRLHLQTPRTGLLLPSGSTIVLGSSRSTTVFLVHVSVSLQLLIFTMDSTSIGSVSVNRPPTSYSTVHDNCFSKHILTQPELPRHSALAPTR